MHEPGKILPLAEDSHTLLRKVSTLLWKPSMQRGLPAVDMLALRTLFSVLSLDQLWLHQRHAVCQALQDSLVATKGSVFSLEATEEPTLPKQFNSALNMVTEPERSALKTWLAGLFSDSAPSSYPVSQFYSQRAWIEFSVYLQRTANLLQRGATGYDYALTTGRRLAKPVPVQSEKDIFSFETISEVAQKEMPSIEVQREYPRITHVQRNLPAYSRSLAELQATLHSNAQELRAQHVTHAIPNALFSFSETALDKQSSSIWSSAKQMVPNIWVIGDLHGDLELFDRLLDYIDSEDEDKKDGIIILGDIIDRGPDSALCIMRLFSLYNERPGKVVFMIGNHEAGLQCNHESFFSAVSPAEFSEWLNASCNAPEKQDRIEYGKNFITFLAGCPAAIFMDNGVMFAHGGVPHRDLWESVHTVADLESSICHQDFFWGRFRSDVKKRLPNRYTLSGEYGTEDFSEFCSFSALALNLPVHTLIRGHDHILEGIDICTINTQYAVVTCTSMQRKKGNVVGRAGLVRVALSGEIECISLT